MIDLWHNPIFRMAFAGFVTAVWTDIRVWKSWGDARFNISTASWRWFEGTLAGAIIGGGFGVAS
jgi:hypothetical protein